MPVVLLVYSVSSSGTSWFLGTVNPSTCFRAITLSFAVSPRLRFVIRVSDYFIAVTCGMIVWIGSTLQVCHAKECEGVPM
ncbi:hypothetical protein F4802DRAFT_580306 [Xylaria palmicola]|nr:hypothetical protein F4802DRAFT_580306 [Xylaria palmicola]